MSLVALLAAIVSAAGCNEAQRMYNTCQVGQPLPGDLPAKAHLSRLGVSHSSQGSFILPPMGSLSTARVLKDDDGRVVARSCNEWSVWTIGLWTSVEARYVLEVQIPPECFTAPSKDWTPSERVAFLRFWEFFAFISSKPNSRASTQPAGSPSAMDCLTYSGARKWVLSGLSDEVLIEGMDMDLRRKAKLLAELRKAMSDRSSAAATSSPTTGPTTNPFACLCTPPQNVPDFLMFIQVISPLVSGDSPQGIVNSFLSPGCDPSAAFALAGAFSDVTRPGFKRELTDENGVKIIIENLGGRRVRIETKNGWAGCTLFLPEKSPKPAEQTPK
jgi:hypothetical protein